MRPRVASRRAPRSLVGSPRRSEAHDGRVASRDRHRRDGHQGRPVDLGEGCAHRRARPGPRRRTPRPRRAVAEVGRGAARQSSTSTGPIGSRFPSVVLHGVVKTASNIDASWIGTDAVALFADGDRTAGGRRERRRRRGNRRGPLRRRQGPGRRRRPGHPRHGDRQRPLRRRASSCPTPSSATSTCTTATPRTGPPSPPRARPALLEGSGRTGSPSTSSSSSRCCGPTCSSSAAA